MTTQLRLVEPPDPRPVRVAKRPTRSTTRRARAASTRRGRRAVAWGDWHLDAGTRSIGRAGVARARQALEAAAEQELRAS